MFTPIPNHAQKAIERLITQYRGKTTVEGIVAGIVTPLQDLEDAIGQLNTARTLEGSQGVQLDLLGAIVGVARVGGQGDAAYRLAIKAKIQNNSSQGQAAAIIATYQLITGVTQCLLDEFFPAAFMMESAYQPPTLQNAYDIIAILDSVAAGGVRAEGLIAYEPDEAFSFDGNLPGAGFGDATDPTAGGLFSTYYPPGGEFAFAGDDPAGMGFGDIADSLVGGQFVSL